MATELFLKRSLNKLVPADARSEGLLRDLPKGRFFRAVITQPRNLSHHNKFFALLHVIFPHQDMYPTEKSLLRNIKKALGLGEWVEYKDGRTEFFEDSISFTAMKQDEFEQFYARFIDLVTTKILPGVDSADLEREVNEIMAGRKGDQAA